MIGPNIDSKDYYDFLPPNIHRAGDIWRGMPTFGMLGRRHCSAIVITPACDLAQRKCETITYVPVIGVEEFLSSPDFFSEVWSEMFGVLTAQKANSHVAPPNRFELPSTKDLLRSIKSIPPSSKASDRIALDKLKAYQRFVERHNLGKSSKVAELGVLFPKKRFEDILKGIVTNAYKTSIHFLPFDKKPSHSSAVQQHSVALFRYPLTIPIAVLDLAQLCTANSWSVELSNNTLFAGLAGSLEQWPIRMATLRGDFLADLISRYIAMYVRLGSPDFTKDTVGLYVSEIGSWQCSSH